MVDMDASDDDEEERVVTDDAEKTSADATDVETPMARPEDLNDLELYHEYQAAKEDGPQLRLDELQLEVAQRWEDLVESNLLGE